MNPPTKPGQRCRVIGGRTPANGEGRSPNHDRIVVTMFLHDDFEEKNVWHVRAEEGNAQADCLECWLEVLPDLPLELTTTELTRPSMNDRAETQRFTIQNALTTHCGKHLSAPLVDVLTAEIVQEMRTGPTAWAFQIMRDRAQAEACMLALASAQKRIVVEIGVIKRKTTGYGPEEKATLVEQLNTEHANLEKLRAALGTEHNLGGW